MFAVEILLPVHIRWLKRGYMCFHMVFIYFNELMSSSNPCEGQDVGVLNPLSPWDFDTRPVMVTGPPTC